MQSWSAPPFLYYLLSVCRGTLCLVFQGTGGLLIRWYLLFFTALTLHSAHVIFFAFSHFVIFFNCPWIEGISRQAFFCVSHEIPKGKSYVAYVYAGRKTSESKPQLLNILYRKLKKVLAEFSLECVYMIYTGWRIFMLVAHFPLIGLISNVNCSPPYSDTYCRHIDDWYLNLHVYCLQNSNLMKMLIQFFLYIHETFVAVLNLHPIFYSFSIFVHICARICVHIVWSGCITQTYARLQLWICVIGTYCEGERAFSPLTSRSRYCVPSQCHDVLDRQ